MFCFRGGKFEQPPLKYPSTAWFTYDGCGYTCQVTEYIYWGVSAWVGALAGRYNFKQYTGAAFAELRIHLETVFNLKVGLEDNFG